MLHIYMCIYIYIYISLGLRLARQGSVAKLELDVTLEVALLGW